MEIAAGDAHVGVPSGMWRSRGDAEIAMHVDISDLGLSDHGCENYRDRPDLIDRLDGCILAAMSTMSQQSVNRRQSETGGSRRHKPKDEDNDKPTTSLMILKLIEPRQPKQRYRHDERDR